MSTDVPPDTDTPQTPPQRRPGFFRRHWGKLTLLVLLLLPVAVFALWATIALGFAYSSGQRTGYVEKFSRKGWICKTWEGEIAMATTPGTAPQRFAFSVRSDSIAAEIQKLQGQRVALEYEQHRYVPGDCFGETEYFVTGVRGVAGP